MSSIQNVQDQETAEAPAEQIAVDGSVGSDNDTSGLLNQETASKDESDTPHHARSNSVKKPTSFRPVSVTKNFLAKAGTPTALSAKTNGDNGATCLSFYQRYELTDSSHKCSSCWKHHATSSQTSACRQDSKREQGLTAQILTFRSTWRFWPRPDAGVE